MEGVDPFARVGGVEEGYGAGPSREETVRRHRRQRGRLLLLRLRLCHGDDGLGGGCAGRGTGRRMRIRVVEVEATGERVDKVTCWREDANNKRST